jgi:hypothetical protein
LYINSIAGIIVIKDIMATETFFNKKIYFVPAALVSKFLKNKIYNSNILN